MDSDLPSLFADDAGGTSAARELLFREAGTTNTPAQVVSWWERRRLAYNVGVGAAGLSTIAWIKLLSLGMGWPLAGPPLMAIAAYALAANVMYTGGWISELALQRVFGRRTPVVGSAIFRYGFAFAVGLTLLPIPVSTFAAVMRGLGKLLGW